MLAAAAAAWGLRNAGVGLPLGRRVGVQGQRMDLRHQSAQHRVHRLVALDRTPAFELCADDHRLVMRLQPAAVQVALVDHLQVLRLQGGQGGAHLVGTGEHDGARYRRVKAAVQARTLAPGLRSIQQAEGGGAPTVRGYLAKMCDENVIKLRADGHGYELVKGGAA